MRPAGFAINAAPTQARLRDALTASPTGSRSIRVCAQLGSALGRGKTTAGLRRIADDGPPRRADHHGIAAQRLRARPTDILRFSQPQIRAGPAGFKKCGGDRL